MPLTCLRIESSRSRRWQSRRLSRTRLSTWWRSMTSTRRPMPTRMGRSQRSRRSLRYVSRPVTVGHRWTTPLNVRRKVGRRSRRRCRWRSQMAVIGMPWSSAMATARLVCLGTWACRPRQWMARPPGMAWEMGRRWFWPRPRKVSNSRSCSTTLPRPCPGSGFRSKQQGWRWKAMGRADIASPTLLGRSSTRWRLRWCTPLLLIWAAASHVSRSCQQTLSKPRMAYG